MNRSQSTPLMTAAAVLVACMALSLGHGMATRRAPSAHRSAAAEAGVPPPAPSRGSGAARDSRVELPARESDPASFEDLAARVASDARFREGLEQRYLATDDVELRRTLTGLLAAAPAAELLAFTELLSAHHDAKVRRDAYALLAHVPSDDEAARRLRLRALREERDGSALRALLRGLPQDRPPFDTSDPIASQLLEVAAHQDPGVRAEVLPQLARRVGQERLEAVFHGALIDLDANVRAAGIESIVASGVGSAHLRSALLDIACNDAEGRGLRIAALGALEGFGLSAAERELKELLVEQLVLLPDDDHGLEMQSPTT